MRRSRTARKAIVVALLGVLTLTGVVLAGLALGAPNKPDFSLALSPTSQSVAAGSSVTYSVTITRQGGFSSAVALSVGGATGGLTWSFNPASPVSGSTTVLTVTAAPTATPGNRSLTLTGTGGGKTKTAAFSLNVQPAAQPSFNLAVSPSAQTISQDETTSYAVSITRLNSFTSNVALSVAGLPKKTSATFSPTSIAGPSSIDSTLTIVSQHNAEIGTFTLTVTASGGSPLVTRTASVSLSVSKKHDLGISGNASSTLYPGTTSDLDLTLTNANNFTIRVTALGVSVEEQTTNASCSGAQNFTTSALVGTVDVPANTSAKLSQLGVAEARRPKISFLDTPSNQDACKNATVTMQYSGTAVKP
jgi:uncharacterized membrane protein